MKKSLHLSVSTASKFPSNLSISLTLRNTEKNIYKGKNTWADSHKHNSSQLLANIVSLFCEGTALLCFPKRGWQGCQRTLPAPAPKSVRFQGTLEVRGLVREPV